MKERRKEETIEALCCSIFERKRWREKVAREEKAYPKPEKEQDEEANQASKAAIGKESSREDEEKVAREKMAHLKPEKSKTRSRATHQRR